MSEKGQTRQIKEAPQPPNSVDNEAAKEAIASAKAPPPQMVRAAVVPEVLMQGLVDALRDHVPHKVADSLLAACKSVQYGSFPVTKG